MRRSAVASTRFGCGRVRVLPIARERGLDEAESREGVVVASSLQGVHRRRIREKIRGCCLESCLWRFRNQVGGGDVHFDEAITHVLGQAVPILRTQVGET